MTKTLDPIELFVGTKNIPTVSIEDKFPKHLEVTKERLQEEDVELPGSIEGRSFGKGTEEVKCAELILAATRVTLRHGCSPGLAFGTTILLVQANKEG